MIAGHSPASWLVFIATVAVLLVVDLAVLNRAETVRRSALWCLTVFCVAGLFCAFVAINDGRADAIAFATGYVVEFSLSVDNLLVFIMVLRYFAVPLSAQATALKWGILGALLMRGIVIAAGTMILREFHWVIYVFGAMLILTAIRMVAKQDDADIDIERNPLLRLARRILPVSEHFSGSNFFVREGNRLVATPLLLVVLVIEWTDLVFAADSIPAIFAITRDPFLVYTSNVFAIVGLRALYFVLAAMLTRFAYLKIGVAIVLFLVGTKMLLSPWVHVPSLLSLAVIVGVLGGSVAASAMKATIKNR